MKTRGQVRLLKQVILSLSIDASLIATIPRFDRPTRHRQPTLACEAKEHGMVAGAEKNLASLFQNSDNARQVKLATGNTLSGSPEMKAMVALRNTGWSCFFPKPPEYACQCGLQFLFPHSC